MRRLMFVPVTYAQQPDGAGQTSKAVDRFGRIELVLRYGTTGGPLTFAEVNIRPGQLSDPAPVDGAPEEEMKKVKRVG